MRWLSLIIILVIISTLTGSANADVVEIAPTEVVPLPGDGTDVSRVALRFELGAIPQTPNIRLIGASLEWTMGSLPALPANFWVESVDQPWTKMGVETGSEAIVPTRLMDEWDITPSDHSRIGGLVRLDLDWQAGEWLAEPQRNYGVVLASSSIDQETLTEQAEALKLLVRYNLVRR